MTEEKIKEMFELLTRREAIKNEIENLEKVLKKEPNQIGFSLIDSWIGSEYSYIMTIKDKWGFLRESICKVLEKDKDVLRDVQKQIEEL